MMGSLRCLPRLFGRLLIGLLAVYAAALLMAPWGPIGRHFHRDDRTAKPFHHPRVDDRFQILPDLASQPDPWAPVKLTDPSRTRAKSGPGDAWGCSTGGRCALVVPSTNLQLYEIVLGKKVRRKQDPEESLALHLHVPRAYIDWAPYLDPEPISMVKLNTILPNLAPEALMQWEVRSRASGELKEELHRARVPIEIRGARTGTPKECGSDTSRRCSPNPTDRMLWGEIGEGRSLDQPCAERLELFDCRAPHPRVSDALRTQILIPTAQFNYGTTYLRCDNRPDSIYSWCNVISQIDPDVMVNYQFERSRLADFHTIHVKVMRFVLTLIKRRQLVAVPVESDSTP